MTRRFPLVVAGPRAKKRRPFLILPAARLTARLSKAPFYILPRLYNKITSFGEYFLNGTCTRR
ncbi:hypothetical protein ANACOL_00460 [Anaerotruncus colihominis DSM 17241]|uniref:Uncharacterized protein n=1 Tax=Anaerotruncus colihominis DSM 17241 TaxID=445972 RepID=B0P6T3_9FIRM|nr:hypothetical protein ANACOL_00460 [Anaerotruncus colihominis DSM 17241]